MFYYISVFCFVHYLIVWTFALILSKLIIKMLMIKVCTVIVTVVS